LSDRRLAVGGRQQPAAVESAKMAVCRDDLRTRIAAERKRMQALTADDVCRCVIAGDITSASGNILFHTSPRELGTKLESTLSRLSDAFPAACGRARDFLLLFLAKLAIDLGTFLPHWTLADGLRDSQIRERQDEVVRALDELSRRDTDAVRRVMETLRADVFARLRAEGISSEEGHGMVEAIVGDRPTAYVLSTIRELRSSNLSAVARARRRGETRTELGNDYASFLQHMLWLGGSFATTNPVLITMAWRADEELWSGRVDELIRAAHPDTEITRLLVGPRAELDLAIAEMSSVVTMAVVESNCRMLRDIFLITEGREGYVSLQVDPSRHGDRDGMLREAVCLYEHLERRLGGVPNVVFKLPATAAGKSVAEELTSRGIGVTITVQFAVFQALSFGKALAKGSALVSYLALMNGRMASPVRDELVEYGIGGGAEAARWAGVEVARKACRRLYGSRADGGAEIDPDRVKLLIASLRVYGDWIPDISELWGCPVITIFPDVRRAFESHPRTFAGNAVDAATPAEALDMLLRSEIFRQAWWTPGDPDEQKPSRVLTLDPEDADALASWQPMANTLSQFTEFYQQLGEMIEARMRAVAKRGGRSSEVDR